MNWIEVKAFFKAPPLDWSLYVDIFDRHGCENTLQEDHLPALSSAVVDLAGSGEVVRKLSEDLVAAGAERVETRSLVDEDWQENWKRFFHPREVGRKFLIRPTWEPSPVSDRLEIVLDPGQAFGTGDHPTTRMCLELLEEIPVSGAAVADIGCGSGILSIGACLLGARKVFAVDIEPLAVEVARENAQLNKVEFEAFTGQGIDPIASGAPFDLVLSNIISAALIQLSGTVAATIRPGGWWVISGIIVENWPDVLATAESAGFSLSSRLEEDGWVGATLSRNT